MPSHARHKYLRRVTWNQMGNEEIDCNRSPERNKIKTNATEQITHAYPLPEERPPTQGYPQDHPIYITPRKSPSLSVGAGWGMMRGGGLYGRPPRLVPSLVSQPIAPTSGRPQGLLHRLQATIRARRAAIK